MPINKFKPEAPDRHLKKGSDMSLAKFGHLNRLVDDINSELEAIQADIPEAFAPAADVTDAAGDGSDIVEKFNELLANLRTAGILA